jgi:hypothetical protein
MTMFQNLHRSMTQGETLKIGCTACPHIATLTRSQAIARFGPDATPCDLRRRLARAPCRACGTPRPSVWI